MLPKLFVSHAIFVICYIISSVNGEHKILITLNSLKIDGSLSDGITPCNPYYGSGIPCYPRPKICIEPISDTATDPDYCTYSFIDLGILDVGSSNSIDFNKNYGLYGAWLNPNKLSFPGGYSGFNVKLHIWNADRTNYQLIEKFFWTINASYTGQSGTVDTTGIARTIVSLTWNTTNSVVPITTTTRLTGPTQPTSPASKGPQPTPGSTEGSASEGPQPTPASTEGSASEGPQPTPASTEGSASEGSQPTPASTEGSASEGPQPTPASTEGSASEGPQPTPASTEAGRTNAITIEHHTTDIRTTKETEESSTTSGP
uniref:Uncharacterized protein n=1 Tax=Acrobeloides nanus TaxID=290746 RepID=A0A914CU26_9BILA